MTNNKDNKKRRLSSLLYKVVKNKNGNAVRHLTRIIAKAYKSNPEKLRKYFNDSEKLISGIATSAYNFLTGEITPMQSTEYGGLGAILTNTPKNLIFKDNQLWYSKNSGCALLYSKNSGYALRGSENSGSALSVSTNSENALKNSENSGHALWHSENSGCALEGSENSEYVFKMFK